MWKICRSIQAAVRFACCITEVTHAHNNKILISFPWQNGNAKAPQPLFCSLLGSIAVHIHSVFCVPCTVLIMWSSPLVRPSSVGNCSAVSVAVSLRYMCTESSVSVTCTTTYRTLVHVRTYCLETL